MTTQDALYAELCKSVAAAQASRGERYARREARNRGIVYAAMLVILFLVVFGAWARPSYVHCIGFDDQTSCTDTRTGAEWP